MRYKHLLPGFLVIFGLLLSACAKPAPPASDNDSSASHKTEAPLSPSETGRVSLQASVYVVTDTSGRTVTDTEGKVVTSVGTHSSTAAAGTATTLSSRSAGSKSSRPLQSHMTIVENTTRDASSRQPGSTTTSRTEITTGTGSEAATTKAPPATTTAPPKPSEPWRHPYDLPQIYATCKREIERLGMVWEEGLRPDSLGVSWDNPENTVVYTYYPEDFSLRDYVFNELLPFYKKQPYTRQSCRIWLESYEESPGDYLIYFLERR